MVFILINKIIKFYNRNNVYKKMSVSIIIIYTKYRFHKRYIIMLLLFMKKIKREASMIKNQVDYIFSYF